MMVVEACRRKFLMIFGAFVLDACQRAIGFQERMNEWNDRETIRNANHKRDS